MRLRCPTSAGASVESRCNGVSPPALPAIQASCSLSRFCSYSRATLIWNMRVPFGDVLMQRAWIGVRGEPLPQFLVGEHLRQLREDLKMPLRRVLRNQQHEDERHRLAVGRVEGYGLRQAHERAHRLLQALDAAVRNGHSVSEARRPET